MGEKDPAGKIPLQGDHQGNRTWKLNRRSAKIGRELKVSKLRQDAVVVIAKAGQAGDGYRLGIHGKYGHGMASRRRPRRDPDPDSLRSDHEQVEDDDGVPIKIFEYLGEI